MCTILCVILTDSKLTLLHLRTRDLTCQDHFLNVEMLLCPERSGLLVKKHKALTAQCGWNKGSYKQQHDLYMKTWLAEQRRMGLRRERLLGRKSQIATNLQQEVQHKPPRSAGCDVSAQGMMRMQRSITLPNIIHNTFTKRSSEVFITQSHSIALNGIASPTDSTAPPFNNNANYSKIQTDKLLSRPVSRVITRQQGVQGLAMLRSGRKSANMVGDISGQNSKPDVSPNYKTHDQRPLEVKVNEFIVNISSFIARQPSSIS